MRCLHSLTLSVLAACQAPVAGSTSTSSSSSSTTSDGGDGSAHGTGAAGTTSEASTGGASTTGEASSGGASTSEASTSEASTTGDTSSSSGTTGEVKTCKKIDILFSMVSNSDLGDSWGALEDLAPHLAERLEADFGGWDVHLMFANASGTWGSQYCKSKCGTPDPCMFDYPCDYEPSTCDLTLGAGVTFPVVPVQSEAPCPIDGDRRYVVSGQEDLPGTVGCMIYSAASGAEKAKYPIARATLDAIGPQSAPGGCNEGFFREDAYLVLFLITTTPDFYSEGTPEAWTKELKSHKGGKFDKIYFIGLTMGCMSGWEYGDFEPLREWTESLYYHAIGSACTSDVIKYVDPALDYVLGDCQE